MLIFTNKTIPHQPPELEEGNKEYKTFLVPKFKKNYNRNRHYRPLTFDNYIQKKSTQLLYRLIEGNGKAIYILGITDSGKIRGMTQEEMNITIKNIELMAQEIKADIKATRVYNGGRGFVCTVRLTLPIEDLYKKVEESII